MPYNSLIGRSDASALIPQEVSNDIIRAVPQSSSAMRFARQLQSMSSNQRRMPVMSALATAYFVSGDTGLKQTTEVSWENKYIDAEEVAAIVPVPESVLDDASFDIWSEVRPSLIEAFGKAIDEAVFYGTNIPASWTTNLGAAGIVARATAASHTISAAAYADLYEALLGESGGGAAGLMMLIEADGFVATGHVAHVSMKGKLRNVRATDGVPIFRSGVQGPTPYELDGSPIDFPLNGAVDSSQSLMISGDWRQMVYAVRRDITYKILTEAVIQDAGGNIVYNLAQQDMVAMRAVMRLGFALPNPINRMQSNATTRCPFAVLTA